MNAVTPLTDHYVAEFHEARELLPGKGVAWLQRRREQALECFKQDGFPTTRDEDWKYTNIRSIQKHAFRLAGESCIGLVEDDLGEALLESLDTHRLVFVARS